MKPEPQNLEAEQNVLGALMLAGRDGSSKDEILSLVEPEHFAHPSNGVLFRAIRSLREQGQPAEPLLVCERLEQAGELKEAGGRHHVRELASLVPAASNGAHFARLVREAWEKRTLGRALGEALAASQNGNGPARALEIAERKLLDVRSLIERGRASVIGSGEAADEFQRKTERPPDSRMGIATPFRFLKRLQGGRLYVLGGYQADGKTAVAVQFLRAAAADGSRVGYVSVEMSWRDLTDRVVASFGVPYGEAMSGRISDAHKPLVEHALEEMRSWQCDLIDDEGVGIGALRRYQQLGRYQLLIIDHLHRFDWEDRRELERAVRTITNIARQADIPVLLLAQLHRRGDEFPRPTMASIRESGMIEAEAAMVAFVWRRRDENKLPTHEAEFVVAKNRYGPPSSFPLHFRSQEVRFVEVDG